MTTAKLPLPRSLPVMVGVRVSARARARARVRAVVLAELVVLLHLALLEETHGAEDLWRGHALSGLCLAKGAAKPAAQEAAVARDGAGVGRWYVGATAVPGRVLRLSKIPATLSGRGFSASVRNVGLVTAPRLPARRKSCRGGGGGGGGGDFQRTTGRPATRECSLRGLVQQTTPVTSSGRHMTGPASGVKKGSSK